ncbi:MAG: response regulator [Candidatus Geothermincolales bacterium]
MSPSALVIDDDKLLLRLVELNLAKMGIKVIQADNGKDAIRLALEEKPDLILLDIMMPQMDGFEVIRQLKAIRETSSIPVVMLTAKSNPEDREKCQELGAVGYITKPFRLEELRGLVQRILQELTPETSG